MINRVVLILMMAIYLIAGINHFINSEFYVIVIPPYLPSPNTLNYLAGFSEIIFATLLFFPRTRAFASFAIVLMLIAFLPVHIYMIEKVKNGPYILGDLTVSPLLAWVRIPFQLLFMAWAYWCAKMKFSLTEC